MEYNPNPVAEVIPSPLDKHRKDATTAMVCGIIGLVLVWWGVSTIAALILSIIAYNKAKRNRAFALSMNIQENGQNKAGYICGLIGIIASAIVLFFITLAVVLIILFGAASYSYYLPDFLESIESSLRALPSLMAVL